MALRRSKPSTGGLRPARAGPLASAKPNRNSDQITTDLLTPDRQRRGFSFGAGAYSAARITDTEGVHLTAEHQTPEMIEKALERIVDPKGELMPTDAYAQISRLVGKTAAVPQGSP